MDAPPSTTPREPTPEEQRLLQAVFDRFAATAEWPNIGRLKWELARDGVELEVETIGHALDPAWGRVGNGNHESASLTLHGIARCSGSEELLADVLAAVRLAADRWLSTGPYAQITSDDLMGLLGTNVVRVNRVFILLQQILGIGGGSGSAEGNWHRDITPDIHRYRDVATVDGLLARIPYVRPPWLLQVPTLPPNWLTPPISTWDQTDTGDSGSEAADSVPGTSALSAEPISLDGDGTASEGPNSKGLHVGRAPTDVTALMLMALAIGGAAVFAGLPLAAPSPRTGQLLWEEGAVLCIGVMALWATYPQRGRRGWRIARWLTVGILLSLGAVLLAVWAVG